MPDFQSLRGTPRIIAINRTSWIDLPFDLDEDPDTLSSMLTALQSLGGQVQTQPGVPSSRIRLLMRSMDSATRKKWKILFDRTLVQGGLVELIRDSGRYFWLAGDSARDLEAGQPPQSGSQYTLATFAAPDPDSPIGGISVDPANPGSATRTNLVANGDMLDNTGGVPTGWTNNTPTTLGMIRSSYLQPNGMLGRTIEFFSKGAGAKSAQIDFTLGGYNATTLPGDVLQVTALIRADLERHTIVSAVMNVDLIIPSSVALADDIADITPTDNWVRYSWTADTSTIVPTDATLRLKITFTDDLQYLPIYLTELQIEARAFYTAFIPYSTVRTALTGSRAAADALSYLNGLAYACQIPTWGNADTWAFTVGFTFTPGWNGASIPAATLTLYQDGDTDDVDTVPALRIHCTSTTIVATAKTPTGTSLTATKTAFSWSAGVPVRIIASFTEGLGGEFDLYVDGTIADTTADHGERGLRQGKYFWIGSRPDGSQTATGTFSDVVLAPCYIDGTDVTVAEFAAGERPDRNSWRAVLDPAQKGRSDRVNDNQVDLEAMFIEHVR